MINKLRTLVYRDQRSRALLVALVCSALAVTACDDDSATNPDDEDASNGGELPDSGEKPPAKEDAGTPPKPTKDAGSEKDAGTKPPIKDAGPVEDASEPEPDAAADAGEDAGPAVSLGGLTVDISTADQEGEIDLFSEWGHRVWFEVSEDQLSAMNIGDQGGYGPYGGYGYGFGYGGGGDIYQPVPSGNTYADNVLVENAETDHVAEYGKVGVAIDQRNYRPWDPASIPSLFVEADQFQDDGTLGGYRDLHMSNGVAGTIFREQIIYRIYRDLGYPAPKSGYSFIGATAWGEGLWVPMIVSEGFSPDFCEANAEALGGSCENLWAPEFDFVDAGGTEGTRVPTEWCKADACDTTRYDEFVDALKDAPQGTGFRDALADFVDWERFHQFQCLSWIVGNSDEAIHSSRNSVMIQREDGRFVWVPMSVELGAGFSGTVELPGQLSLARGCQGDPACWQDTIAACEDLVDAFDALNPEYMVDTTRKKLTELGMMRDGDKPRARELREWLLQRQIELPDELEYFRFLQDANGECQNDLQACNDGTCGTEEQCIERRCGLAGQWCDSHFGCIEREAECQICPEETPYWCDYNYECTTDQDTCYGGICGPGGYVYCPYYNQCVPPNFCPGMGNPDGGIIIDPGPGPGPRPIPL